MSDVRRAVLEFVAEHEFVVLSQIGRRLSIAEAVAAETAAGLERDGLVRTERLVSDGPVAFRITSLGLGVIGCGLPAPLAGLDGFRHELGVVWLWIAAWDGAFGEPQRVLSRRRMAWLDAGGDGRRFGVRVGDEADGGEVGYPDVLLVIAQGRIPIHLELSVRPRAKLEALLRGYAQASAAMLFLVNEAPVGQGVERVAADLGLSDRVQVQRVGTIAG